MPADSLYRGARWDWHSQHERAFMAGRPAGRQGRASLWSGQDSLCGGGKRCGIHTPCDARRATSRGCIPGPLGGDGKIVDRPKVDLGWQAACWCPEREEEHGDEGVTQRRMRGRGDTCGILASRTGC
ncbi:hypothetical protein JB92DRAFT_2870895 [Gautieria morchelliformis]|nr:hypothetical protein JB92DRAFT_2870895 [Gautieria morchelliformis]